LVVEPQIAVLGRGGRSDTDTRKKPDDGYQKNPTHRASACSHMTQLRRQPILGSCQVTLLNYD
jgi:hypothetical protein